MIFPERVFGRPVGAQWNVSGDAKAATSARAQLELLGQLVAGLALGVLRQRDEGVERRALDVVRDAHERGLGDLRRVVASRRWRVASMACWGVYPSPGSAVGSSAPRQQAKDGTRATTAVAAASALRKTGPNGARRRKGKRTPQKLTAGCATSADSTSAVPMLWPDTTTTSSARRRSSPRSWRIPR